MLREGTRYIFSAAHGGPPHGLSRGNGIFETRRCPESNNTESSFNKGLATIYRSHASHSHLSASTRTSSLSTLLSVCPIVHSFAQTPNKPLSFYGDRMSGGQPPGRHTVLSFSLYRLSISKYFFSTIPLCCARARGRYQIADAFALRERYFSTDLLHYFNERDPIGRYDPFRSRVSPRHCRNGNATLGFNRCHQNFKPKISVEIKLVQISTTMTKLG